MALCPKNLSTFYTTANSNDFVQKSDLNIIVTTCEYGRERYDKWHTTVVRDESSREWDCPAGLDEWDADASDEDKLRFAMNSVTADVSLRYREF